MSLRLIATEGDSHRHIILTCKDREKLSYRQTKTQKYINNKMKITVDDIRKIKVGKPLIKLLDERRECYYTRNLVTYVNNSYPVEGHRYTVHVTKDNIVSISLVEK